MVTTEYAASNGLKIAYETFGDRDDPVMLLVMGLGTQMIAWQDSLCESLADMGYFVVRYDNRDCGLSTHLHEAGVPAVFSLYLGRKAPVPYLLSDLGDDAAGLLDALDVERAHVVGVSMGGMIAQTLAIEHPERVASMTSVMSTTGNRRVGWAKPTLARRLLGMPTAMDREQAIEFAVNTFRLIGSPGWPFEEDYVRDVATRSYDRGHDAKGTLRQMGAIIASGDRSRALPGVDLPALVIHGRQDPLVHISGGRATAKAIPGARFVPVVGMGHDLPSGLHGLAVHEVTGVAHRGRRVLV